MAASPGLTAFFATNDLLAIGAVQALITLGRKVPDDVSVIGITDIQLAHQVHPGLTTVAIHTTAVAELSVDMLIRLIRQPAQPPSMVIAPLPELVIRASTRRRLEGRIHRDPEPHGIAQDPKAVRSGIPFNERPGSPSPRSTP